MGYRTLDIPPKPEDMLPRFEVRNGATLKVSFGCYYLGVGHDPHFHDYMHWPAPNYHPGPICQMHPPRDIPRWRECFPYPKLPGKLEHIDLEDEGYTSVEIVWDDDDVLDSCTCSADFSDDSDNVIEISVDTAFDAFQDKPLEHRFTVFVGGDSVGKDAVCRGIMVVLPGNASN